MLISIVVAMDRNGIIGREGGLPWRLPADLARFKSITMGKPVVMGRRTHESIGRPLPGRENIVVTRDRDFRAPGCTVLHGLGEVYVHCRDAGEIMIVGGADLYTQALPGAGRIYLTEVNADVAGDARFPDFDRNAWRETERHTFRADGRNEYDYSFVILERCRDPGPA